MSNKSDVAAALAELAAELETAATDHPLTAHVYVHIDGYGSTGEPARRAAVDAVAAAFGLTPTVAPISRGSASWEYRAARDDDPAVGFSVNVRASIAAPAVVCGCGVACTHQAVTA